MSSKTSSSHRSPSPQQAYLPVTTGIMLRLQKVWACTPADQQYQASQASLHTWPTGRFLTPHDTEAEPPEGDMEVCPRRIASQTPNPLYSRLLYLLFYPERQDSGRNARGIPPQSLSPQLSERQHDAQGPSAQSPGTPDSG